MVKRKTSFSDLLTQDLQQDEFGRMFEGEQGFVLAPNGSLSDGENYPAAVGEHNVNDFQVDISMLWLSVVCGLPYGHDGDSMD